MCHFYRLDKIPAWISRINRFHTVPHWTSGRSISRRCVTFTGSVEVLPLWVLRFLSWLFQTCWNGMMVQCWRNGLERQKVGLRLDLALTMI